VLILPATTATDVHRFPVHLNFLRCGLYALLGFNVCLFVARGTWSEALDSVAWFVLLALFELETRLLLGAQSRTTAVSIRLIRAIATVAIGASAIGYLYERDWLSAVNAWLWIGVVVLLEFEVHRPHTVTRHRSAFLIAACALYGGLFAVVAAWLWQREWLDAYDGLLWIIAFATIETDLVKTARRAVETGSAESAREIGNES
jgi:hypothetical protein